MNYECTKKKTLKIVSAFAGILFGAHLVSNTLSWIIVYDGLSAKVSGSVHGSYFGGGNGTEEDPYLICSQMQLYYLGWLQNLGYLNSTDDDGNATSNYFKLTTNLDMTGYALPSIGTIQYPFIGNFDGQGYTISNLVITNNEDNMNDVPVYTSGYQEDTNVVGFFGVVGSCREDNNLGPNGEYTYESNRNEVSNFILNNVTVKTEQPTDSKTCIGIAIGYLNAEASSIGVVNSSIYVGGSLASMGTFAGNQLYNISDYGVVGYATEDYKEQHTYTNTKVANPVTDSYQFDFVEEGNDWGGSVDMKTMFTKVQSIMSGGSRSSFTWNLYNKTGYYKNINYNDNATSQYSFFSGSSNFSTSYTYLWGAGESTYTGVDYTQSSFRIVYNNNKLTINNNLNGVTNSTSNSDYNLFSLDDDGHLYATINGTKYYINNSSTSFAVSTTPSSVVVFSGTTTIYPTFKISNTTYYFRYTNSTWQLGTSSNYRSSLSMVNTVNGTFTQTLPGFDTFFPLKAAQSSPYTVDENNTGYILSGTQHHGISTNSGNPISAGDIRVSSYAMSNIKNSLGGNSSFSDSIFTCITRNKYTGGTFMRIKDDYNASSSDNSAISGYTKTHYDDLHLTKYENSRDTLGSIFKSSGSNIYGLHFMPALISINELATLPRAVINKNVYINYQMPRDSIDFQLKDNGVINFFAGSYFTGNDGFFSLHRIFRDPNTNEITDIREIQYIYQKSDNPDYIYYKYVTPDTNNNYYSIDVNLVNSDDLCFDTEWIKFPFGSSSTLIQNIVYYYELPALAGEYALGSVDGGTGAYLFYLDIGANAQKISRVEILQMISSITNTYELPIGVAIISNGTAAVDVDYLDSISTQIQEGYAGEFDIDRNGNTFTVGTTDSHVAVIYAPEDATLLNGNNQQFSVTPVHSTVQNILIKTYIDYNNYTRKTLVYRYVYIDTIVDGGTPVRSTAHILPDSDNPNYYTDNNTPDTSGDLNFPHEYKDWTGTISYDENQTAIVYKYEVPEGSTITQDFDVTYNVTYANPNVTRYDITIDTDTTLTIYFDIITNTYTYTVNGSAVSDNSNVVVNP